MYAQRFSIATGLEVKNYASIRLMALYIAVKFNTNYVDLHLYAEYTSNGDFNINYVLDAFVEDLPLNLNAAEKKQLLLKMEKQFLQVLDYTLIKPQDLEEETLLIGRKEFKLRFRE